MIKGARVVELSQVPVSKVYSYGRSARVFAQLLEIEGRALELEMGTREAYLSLQKALKRIAEKERRSLRYSHSADWKFAYFWVEEVYVPTERAR